MRGHVLIHRRMHRPASPRGCLTKAGGRGGAAGTAPGQAPGRPKLGPPPLQAAGLATGPGRDAPNEVERTALESQRGSAMPGRWN